jgi:hypothetical protein
MNSLLLFLLRNGGGVLREGAEIFIGQALIRAATQRLKGILVFYSVLAVFAVAALAFFYVLLYRGLSLRTSEQSAAAILCAANLLLIAATLAGRALIRSKAPVGTGSPIIDLIKSHSEGLSAEDVNFEAGIAIGNQIGKHMRKAAPQIALAAAVLGLVIGVRPQILGLFRRREPPGK